MIGLKKDKKIILVIAAVWVAIAMLILIAGNHIQKINDINTINYNKIVSKTVALMSTGQNQALYVYNKNCDNWTIIAPDYPDSIAFSPYNYKNTTTDKQYRDTYSELQINIENVKNNINYLSTHMLSNTATPRYNSMMQIYTKYKGVTGLATVVSGSLMNYQHKFTLANLRFYDLYGQYVKDYNMGYI